LLSLVFTGFGEPEQMQAVAMAAVIIQAQPVAKITSVIEISAPQGRFRSLADPW
jgi:hypothetical protein